LDNAGPDPGTLAWTPSDEPGSAVTICQGSPSAAWPPLEASEVGQDRIEAGAPTTIVQAIAEANERKLPDGFGRMGEPSSVPDRCPKPPPWPDLPASAGFRVTSGATAASFRRR
jgi:hypothetical protein